MNKAKDLRDQSLEELEVIYDETCKKLFGLKCKLRAQRKPEKPHEMKHTRKDIARILTVMHEKRINTQISRVKG